jgi:hypothetical protein
MNIDTVRLANAASRFSARITPAWDAELDRVTISEADVTAVSVALRLLSVSSADVNLANSLLGLHRGRPAAQQLTGRDAMHLATAFERIAQAADRADKISRGIYPGPMSGPEAIKLMQRWR